MSERTWEEEMAQPWCPHCDLPIGDFDLDSPPVGEQDGVPVVEVVCGRCLRGPDARDLATGGDE